MTARIARSSRSRSSTRWEMKLSCVLIRNRARDSGRGFLRKRAELAFGFRHLALDGVLESPRGILHGAPELAQLLQLDLAVDIGLDVVDIALQPAEQVAQRARNAGQPLRPDDD